MQTDSSRGEARAPLSERVCDAACLSFALWSLCCHAAVALGGSLTQLVAAFALAAAAALGLLVLWARRPRRAPAPAPPPPPAPPRPPALRALQLAGLVAGVSATLVWVQRGSVVPLWCTAVVLLAAAGAAFLVAEQPQVAPPARGPGREAALWALALGCVAVTLVVHRPDIDDAFYVNLAVAAADFPSRPLLAFDTLHGIEGLPLHLPVYRLHTYEVLNGALSYLTGISALSCFHWISASVAALLVPLVHAKLFRLLTPRTWPACVAALVVVLLAAGETHRWYGNFAFVRLWQGKGIFLFVLTPMVYASAIRFAVRPSLRDWLLLFAAQVGAVGCTSSALWAAPVGALMALCSAVGPTREGLRRFALGALASIYVLAIAWLAKQSVEGVISVGATPAEPALGLEGAFRVVLGDGRLRSFALVSIAAAWAFCPRGLAQRFAIALPLAVVLVLLNPYADHWVRANLTGPSYWRAMWSLPVPVLMALVLTSPLHLNGRTWPRWGGRAACVLLLVGFAVWIPRFSALSEKNGGVARVGIRVGWPGLKVATLPYRWAAALNASVPPGSQVIAPNDVGLWLPTLHHHAYPLVVRKLYLDRYQRQLGAENVEARLAITRYCAGALNVDGSHELFRRGLEVFDVKGVCLRNSDYADEARAILRASGFRRTHRSLDREIWIRS